ncbi:protein SENSITIVE TO UV 2 [Euphorbia lathyris]|uniref:protein SENSITIVE TO UV 2 n=1 Tax=Euphorbia lathyris TaxID=212925 RepID=UPI0033138EEA
MDEQGTEEEEWDADFVDHLIQVEERVRSSSSLARASSSSSSSSMVNPTPNPLSTATFSSFPQLDPLHNQNTRITHSPPRQLSQRPVHLDSYSFNHLKKPPAVFSSVPPLTRPHDDDKDREIQRLKRELGHVSEQLSNMERECFELRNERNKKVEQLKCVSSYTAEKDVGAHCLNSTNLRNIPAPKNHGVHQQSRNTNALDNEIAHQIHLALSSKAIGIQTDNSDESSNLGVKDDLSSHANVSNKLLGIWSSASDQKSGRDLISKLFTACPKDFHFLLGLLSFKISEISGTSVNGEGSSNATLQGQRHSFHPSEAAKISHLYSVLTQIGNGLLPLESLIGPLVELCHLENVDILCSSLTILRVFLKHLLSSGRRFEERDRVKIEGATSHNTSEDRSLFSVTEEEASCARYRLLGTTSAFDPQTFSNNCIWKNDTGFPSCVNWVSLFNFLNSVAVSNEGCVRLEAVSTMNLILLRTTAFEEREMFGLSPIFESIAQFLKMEAGSHVQKQALQLLYLLLNCPRLLIVFCSGCKDANNAENYNNASTSKGFGAILEGLAGCIGGRQNNIQEIELRKKAVIMVAFLASSGNSGFEILVNHKLSGGKSFLILILQMLIWEMDVEVSASLEPEPEPAGSIKARRLLMREALILLNRIVSNQRYSAIVLRILTGSRDMACMSIDIVSRLSREDQVRRRSSDSITMQMRDEIINLAKLLKRRVFTYLGDKIT